MRWNVGTKIACVMMGDPDCGQKEICDACKPSTMPSSDEFIEILDVSSKLNEKSY